MSHPFIMPTVGRIVHFRNGPGCLTRIPTAKDCDHLAAIVTGVTDEGRHINVAVFDVLGTHHRLQYIPLIQDGEVPADTMYYCTWMPYQKGQAVKTEEAERALAAKDVGDQVDRLLGLRIPILDQISELCYAIEKCGASPELTDAVTKASALREPVSELVRHALAMGISAGTHSVSYDHGAGDDKTAMVRVFLEKGAIVKIEGVPLKLDHDAVVRTHPGNVPLIAKACTAKPNVGS